MSSNNEVKEFYNNDIVYRFDKQKKIHFGVVTDSYESSDSVEDFSNLRKGQILVYWIDDSAETAWNQRKIKLVSRTVIPGDIVTRLEQNGKESQRGYCRTAQQYATVQIIGTNKIIEGVYYERLKHVVPIEINVPIYLNDKFGRIRSFDQLITLSSKCGALVKISLNANADIENFWPRKRRHVFQEAFYPGQEVVAMPSHLVHPNWIHKSPSIKRFSSNKRVFTIQNIEVTDVEVVWYDGENNSSASFLNEEELKQIKILETVDSNFLELAESRLFKLTDTDLLAKKRHWIQKQYTILQPNVRKVIHSVNRSNKRQSKPKIMGALVRSPSVDIADQDWCTDEDDDGVDKSTGNAVDGSLRSPTAVIPETGHILCDDTASTSSSSKILKRRHYPPKAAELKSGNTLPVEVLCIYSKATIVWQDGTEERDISTSQLYFSIALDDHEFFPGEWVRGESEMGVFKYGVVQQVDSGQRIAKVKWFVMKIPQEHTPIPLEIEEISVYDLHKHSKYTFHPGSVVRLKPNTNDKLGSVIDGCIEGLVQVQWCDGISSQHWPHELQSLPDVMDFNSDMDPDDDDDSVNNSWETESIESTTGNVTDEATLQNMAARLDFIRSRILHLKEALQLYSLMETFSFVRDLLIIYDNSSYLDKLLDTSFFSLKSKHYQALLAQVKERAKSHGIELRGRLFSDHPHNAVRAKSAEKENMNKMMKLEHRINSRLGFSKSSTPLKAPHKDAGVCNSEPTTPGTPDLDTNLGTANDSLCVELLSMLKTRMDLAYAEIISRIGGAPVLSVMTQASSAHCFLGGNGGANTTIAASHSTQLFANDGGSGVVEQSTVIHDQQHPFMSATSYPTTPDDSLTIPTTNSTSTNATVTPTAHSRATPLPAIATPEKDDSVLATPIPPSPGKVEDCPSPSAGAYGDTDMYKSLAEAPKSHKFYEPKCEPTKRQQFFAAICREQSLMRDSLPPGVWVRTYQDRLDLCSFMIRGPHNTPYEDGLFAFDVQFSADYPRSPPLCHYVSYCSERLNPNLYVEGRVCVSLLGTWMGRDTEVWGLNSTLLQLIVSIQGLILVSEPYYNEAGYEKQIDSQQGCENSRTYNEMVVLKLVQSMTVMLQRPPEVFETEMKEHFAQHAMSMYDRLNGWCDLSITNTSSNKPDFPLLPVSKGLRLSLNTALDRFKSTLSKVLSDFNAP